MKGILLAMIAAILLCAAGCKRSPDPVGKWVLATGGSNNAVIDAMVKATGKTYKLDIKKGGQFSIDAFGETGTGQWTFSVDMVILLVTDGFNAAPGQTPDIPFKLSEDEKTLTWTDRDRKTQVTLVREGS